MTTLQWNGQMATQAVNELIAAGYDRDSSMRLVGLWIDGTLLIGSDNKACQIMKKIENATEWELEVVR